ncbi:AAA family ATPase [Plantactinospora endophytica]|uniref:LuxR family transcriptional regulator n=1 Tax=Plantactinospora endophytica TaxID=673535 RepID=A0ABQ4DRP2_9ACTN|nr:LuxR family transcriptional regulator [Plantactinospora endophytica]GIG85122.1 LuxR family transcriptional regulator [Plantactinospora endophytica]
MSQWSPTVWPFEGRDTELASVVEAFTDSATNAVLIMAPAGLGKTRLAREALHRLGCRTRWVAATRAATAIPFGALAHLLPDEPSRLPEETPEPPDEPMRLPDGAPLTQVGPVGLVRAFTAQVAGWGGRTRVAVGVDDAHLLDDASSTVVANLVSSSAAFVVLTVRTGEPVADCLARLAKEGEAVLLDLAPLPTPVIDRLIDHSTCGTVDAIERRRLRAGAWGNPLALRELLHGAVAGGLTDLIAARLDRLDPATRRVVELVACGEPVPLAFLERLAGPEVVATAEESGLVAAERDGVRVQARLDHPLFGEVLRTRMAAARSRQAYRDLAEQLLATPLRRRDDTLRAALWQVEGGRIVRADLVREGARQAIGRSGLDLAERLARSARSAEPGPPADRLLAEILEYQGRSEEAAALLPVSPPEQPTERLAWAGTRADWFYWGRGDLATAERVLDTAAGHPRVESARAFILVFAGRCGDALRAAETVLDGEHADPQALVWAAAAATASLGFLGHLDRAEAVRLRGMTTATAYASALPWGRFQMEVGACLAHLAAGYPETAAAVAAEGHRTATQGGVPMMVSAWALYEGIVATVQGRLPHAEVRLAEARAGFDQSDTFRLRRACLAAQSFGYALRGQYAVAAELMADADRTDNGTNQLFAPWIATWRGWLALAGGDTAAAVRHAEHGAELAAAAGMPCVEAQARYDMIRLGGRADLARMAALPGPVPGLLAAAARALSEPDGPAMVRVAEQLAGLGHHLVAAELATAAGRLLRSAGYPARAALANAAATEWRANCPGVRTPLLAHADLGSLLTVRERQIALLATRQPSRSIAEQLGLALPTVNNALARIYTKLGITGRAELRGLLDVPAEADESATTR